MSNVSPAEEKIREEILSLREERRANRLKGYLEVVRTLFLAAGAIIVFWAIQRPESVLNRSASHEGIARERARLLLEWLKEPDSNKRLQALAVIRSAYGPSDDDWLRSAEEAMRSQAQSEAVAKDLELLRKLSQQEQEKKDESSSIARLGSGPGIGGELYAIRAELSEIRTNIAAAKQRLQANGFDMSLLKEN